MSQIPQDHVDCGEDFAFYAEGHKTTTSMWLADLLALCSHTCLLSFSILPSVYCTTPPHFLISIYWCVYVNRLGCCWLWVIGNHTNYLTPTSMDFRLGWILELNYYFQKSVPFYLSTLLSSVLSLFSCRLPPHGGWDGQQQLWAHILPS